MPSEQTLYVFCPDDGDESGGEGDEWLQPRPIGRAVVERIVAETDESEDDIDDIDEYVDREEVAAVLDSDDADASLTFTVEGHEVTVDGGGTLDVDPA